MKKEEKKHPVDDLFSRKLRDLETKPRPEAWTRLEGRLTHPPRRVMPAWVKYSAAASVLLVAGWWMMRPDGMPAPDVASVPAAKTAPVIRTEKPADQVAHTGAKTDVPAPEVQPEKALSTEQQAVAPAKRADIAPGRAGMTAQQKHTVPAEVQEIRVTTPAVPDPAPRQEQVALKPIEPVQPAEAVKQPAAASLAKASEEKVFVVNVTAPSLGEPAGSEPDTTEKRPKGKFLARLAKGWKHIQDGEWSEVGLKKKGILARAEDNLFNKR